MPGSVDEELLKDILEGTLVNTFIKALAIIEAQWRRAPRTYERLRWLVNRWQLLLPEGARDVKATEGWTPEIWSEEGGKLKHGDERAARNTPSLCQESTGFDMGWRGAPL